MELNNLNPLSPYKIKSLKKFDIYFIHHLARMYWAHLNKLYMALIS